MKQYEKDCIDYAHKFIKSWDYYCIAKDSWLLGRRTIIEELQKIIDSNPTVDIKALLTTYKTEDIEVEIKNGQHQIGSKSVGN